jgi:succinate dehydrogenase/fumarate reductase flavoprotein subunit
VLIVGSGAAGLTASLRAQSLGLSPLVIEKGAKVGGTSSYSGGSVWIPCNPVSRAAGLAPGDDREAVLRYFDAAVGDVGPASSIARREAFVDEGPKMVKFLNDAGFRWRPIVGYADYFPELPGGRSDGGRGVEGEAFDLRKLGAWRDN